jgi:hypothetical protein
VVTHTKSAIFYHSMATLGYPIRIYVVKESRIRLVQNAAYLFARFFSHNFFFVHGPIGLLFHMLHSKHVSFPYPDTLLFVDFFVLGASFRPASVSSYLSAFEFFSMCYLLPTSSFACRLLHEFWFFYLLLHKLILLTEYFTSCFAKLYTIIIFPHIYTCL